MNCPNCEIELKCPCKSCQEHREKQGEIAALLWEWVDGDTMRCPICQFTHRSYFWDYYEFYLLDKQRGSLHHGQEEFIKQEIEKWRAKL
jgi:hypothetical protein